MLDTILTIINWIITILIIFFFFTGDLDTKKSVKKFLYIFAITYISSFIILMIVSNMIFHIELFSYEFSPITNFLQKAIPAIFTIIYFMCKFIYLLIKKFNNKKNIIKFNSKPEFLLEMILMKLIDMKDKNLEKQNLSQYCSTIIKEDMEIVNSTFLHNEDIFYTLQYIFSGHLTFSLEQFRKLIISCIPNKLLEYNEILGVSKEKLDEYKKIYTLFIIDIFCYKFIENNIDNKEMWEKLGLYNPWESPENSYTNYLKNLNDITTKRIEYYNKCKQDKIQDIQIYELLSKEIPYKTKIESVWFLRRLMNSR